MAASTKTLTAKSSSLNGDWTVVLPRRGRQRTCPKIKTPEQGEQPLVWAPTDMEINSLRESKLIKRIQTCMKKLETSRFFCALLEQIQSPEITTCFHKVLGSELNMQMVMYGIGSIESYESPRLQLSLALLLKRKLNWIGGMEVFDPVLSTTESRVLEFFNCSVLSVNEQGRRKAQKPTFFFMPHCEAELYDNLLQENSGVGLLSNVVLFGNSFETYEHHLSEFKNSAIFASAKHILSIRKFTQEYRIETVSDDYFGAFHDSSWHFFQPPHEAGR